MDWHSTFARAVARALLEARWLDRRALILGPKVILGLFLAAVLAWAALGQGSLDRNGQPLGRDFLGFWAASSLVLAGSPEAVYDAELHYGAEQAAVGSRDVAYVPWIYPPPLLLLVAPLALLSYPLALVLWSLVMAAAFLLAMRGLVPGRAGLWAALAFPAVLMNLGLGQSGCLTAALVGGGLVLLQRHPAVAGILLGLLAFKPHFAVLLPVVLLAAGQWRVLACAALAAAGVWGLAFLVFGAEVFTAFVAAMPDAQRLVVGADVMGFLKLHSIFAAVRLAGGSLAVAWAGQLAVAVLAAALAAEVWRRRADDALAQAALGLGMLLATPFLFDYDLVLLAIVIAALARLGLAQGFLAGEKTLLLVAWLAPLLARPLAYLGVAAVPLVLLGLALAVAVRLRAQLVPAATPALIGRRESI